MSKRGQALIEAIAGLGVCTLFLTCCLKLWITVVNDFKVEQLQRQNQLCVLTGKENCRPDSGFVLVSMLMKLTVMIFAAHVLIALFLTEEFRWKASNWCFENGLQSLTGKDFNSLSDLQNLENEMNSKAPLLIQFRSVVAGPVSSYDSANDVVESFHRLQWTFKPRFNPLFLKAAESTETFKCGARKTCHDQKCIYSLIADRS